MATTVTRMTEDTAVLGLYVVTCSNCGIQFAVPRQYITARRDDKRDFWCPNGHVLAYTRNEADRLREEMKRKDAAIARADQLLAEERSFREHVERRLSATQGVVTRTKRRVGRGVCPCCHRTFRQLARHMAAKHPGYAQEPPNEQ